MSNVRVRKANGDTLEVTMLTMFSMLAEGIQPAKVLSCLIRAGETKVELQDGLASIWLSLDSLPAPEPVSQPALPLIDFIAQTRLHFSLPARIHCLAGSPAEAVHMIEETVTGAQGVAPGFQVEIDPTEAQAVLANLEVGSYAAIEAVTVTRVDQQRLIGRSTFT